MTATAGTAGSQLEAFFLRQLLAEAKPEGGSALGGGGFAGDTFKGMLDEAIADKMSSAGGLGLAKEFDRTLPGQGALPASAAPPPGMYAAMGGLPTGAGSPGIHLVDPVAGELGSGFGPRPDAHFGADFVHKGLDLHAPIGATVHAAADGVVTHAGRAGTYGNLVTIRHANGYETRYAHLSAVDVHEGDHVTPGEDVGKVGSTGYSALPHLHFELRHDGEAIDPKQLLSTSALHADPRRPNR